ncbi:Protein LTV1-like protein [Mucuna pruriens]|uniref:Protein LTV1-like protein n=1 Tax=Mucuna pruriens TaxID=157652 RepID=A0A371IBC6_MUCPR|nr:Protein LTV1-like protein [Mucuna pruriens]
MGGKKKKFIDKKNSATFQLIARDSSDPSFSQSDRVFVRLDNNPVSFPVAADSVFEDAPDDDDDGTVNGGPLPEDLRKEILELGFPDDGYNYLNHLREIKNTGAGSAFFHNPKFKLQHLPRDVKAYDASRLQISEADGEPEGNSLYTVASKTTSVRVQKAVDPEVAALLDDDDLSRLGSDVEDLEEDFVVLANLDEDGEEKDHLFDGVNFAEESVINRNLNNAQVLQVSAHSRVTDDSGPLDGVTDGVPGVDCVGEKPRARRLLDEQFDLLERQEYGTDDDYDEDGDYYENYQADEDESLAQKLELSFNSQAMDDLELDDNKYKVPADLLNKEASHEEQEESAADVIRRCKEYAEWYEVEDEDKDVVILEESSDESEVWDCETIVSTYSNLDNHPGKIEAPGVTRKKRLAETVSAALGSTSQIISLRGKEKLPVDFLPGGRKPATEKVKGQSIAKTEHYKRKQHGLESKEEKKERKAAVKEERREARRTKKEMKELYRCEAQRAQRAAAVSGPSSIHLITKSGNHMLIILLLLIELTFKAHVGSQLLKQLENERHININVPCY